jgi:hypothetical protein
MDNLIQVKRKKKSKMQLATVGKYFKCIDSNIDISDWESEQGVISHVYALHVLGNNNSINSNNYNNNNNNKLDVINISNIQNMEFHCDQCDKVLINAEALSTHKKAKHGQFNVLKPEWSTEVQNKIQDNEQNNNIPVDK